MSTTDKPADGAVPTPAASDSGAARSRFAMQRRLESLPLVVALILVVVIFQLLTPLFLNPRNLVNLLVELAPLEYIAMASTVMIVMGEIDLSLGSLAGFTCATLATFLLFDGVPWFIALVGAFLVGIAISGIQGIIVVAGRVRSFAVTLAGFLVWYGAQLAVLGVNGYIGLRKPPLNELTLVRLPLWLSMTIVVVAGAVVLYGIVFRRHDARLSGRALMLPLAIGAVVIAALLAVVAYLQTGGGIPLTFVFVLMVATGLWLFLSRTAMGRHMYAVGGDLHAARESGVNINRVKWIGFAIAGALATCAGVSILSYTGGADTSAGTGALLLAGIGATVVGGVSLTGGRGSLWGAFGGAILLEAVGNGLNLMSLPFYAVYVVEGLVVLAALLTDAALRRRLVSR